MTESPRPSSTTPNGERGWVTVTVAARTGLAVPGEQRREIDGDELVAVQRKDVPGLLAAPCGELDPAAAAEPRRLLGSDDLGPEARELLLEHLAPARPRTP